MITMQSLAAAGMIEREIVRILRSVISPESFTLSMSSRMIRSGRWSPCFNPRTFLSSPMASRVNPDAVWSRLWRHEAGPYLPTLRSDASG